MSVTGFGLPKHTDLPIEDETADWDSQQPALEQAVGGIMYDLWEAIDALSSVNSYPSCSVATPKGNKHTVYCNGAIKPEGEMSRFIGSLGFSKENWLAAFKQAADETLVCVSADRPGGERRLIWRQNPEAMRFVGRDGPGVRVRLRIGWDEA